jgi:hypothetical protein
MRLMALGALAVISILWSVPLANAAVKGCAVVQKTPDAHLFLHKAPANSEIVTRLKATRLFVCRLGQMRDGRQSFNL